MRSLILCVTLAGLLLPTLADEPIRMSLPGKAPLPWVQEDGMNFRWDIDNYGCVTDGTNDAYDRGMKLVVNGQEFRWKISQVLLSEDRREIQLGPVARPPGLIVTRRIRVSKTRPGCRWLDIFQNTTDKPLNVEIVYFTNLGGSITPQRLSGETLIKPTAWVTRDLKNHSRPNVIHLFSPAGSEVRPVVETQGNDQLNATYTLRIPPKALVSLCTLHQQRGDLGSDGATALIENIRFGDYLDTVPPALRRTLLNVSPGLYRIGEERFPRMAGRDVLVVDNDEVLYGQILNELYDVETDFGAITLPARQVVGLAVVPAGRDYVRIATTDGQLIAGRLTNGPLRFQLDSGQPVTLPVSQVDRLSYRLSADRPGEIASAHPLLVLRDRQRLAVKRVVQTWTAQTPYGPIRLPSDALASIQLAGSKTTAPHLKLANGSTISGLLSIGPLETTLQMGMQVTLPLWHIREIIFPRSAEIDPNQPTITLLNGDRIIAAVTSPRLVLQTPLEELLLPVDQLAALARQGDSHTFTVTLRDESMLSGRLVEGLEVTLPAGQGLTLPASCIQSVRWPTPSSAPSPATTRPGEATTRPAS